MRTVRFSLTFNDQFNELLEQGEHRFGIAVVEKKKTSFIRPSNGFSLDTPTPNDPTPPTAYAPTQFRKRRLSCSMISTTASFGCILSFTSTPICAISIPRPSSGEDVARQQADTLEPALPALQHCACLRRGPGHRHPPHLDRRARPDDVGGAAGVSAWHSHRSSLAWCHAQPTHDHRKSG
jgi:hypothetical protein